MSIWKKDEIKNINGFRENIYEHYLEDIQKRIVGKQYNELQFYNILPKQSLPKYLQKLDFKKQTQKKVRIFKKQKNEKQEQTIRKKIKQNGNILLLSQIFSLMNNSNDADFNYNLNIKQQQQIRDLQEWQKNKQQNQPKKQKWNTNSKQNQNRKRSPQKQNSMMTQQQRKVQQMHMVLQQMRNSKNYSHEVTISLQTLSKLHLDQKNIVIRTSLIENNAKLIKNELDSKKISVQKQLQQQSHKLQQKRKQYHQLFVNRNKILQQQKIINSQRFQQTKSLTISMPLIKNDKKIDQYKNKKIKVQSSLTQYRTQIQILQKKAAQLRQQYKCIQFAQLLFYRYSLKLGIDCRDNGLSWLIKQLKKVGQKLNQQSLPNYLDKKSKQYLLNKTHHQQVLDYLITQKFNFVKVIMKQTNKNCLKKINQIKGNRKPSLFVQFKQNSNKYFPIPKKYGRSSKLINKINQISNQQLIMDAYAHKNPKALEQFTFQFQVTRNSKQLYKTATNKLRNVYTKDIEHSRVDNQKSIAREKNLNKYNNLLQKIKQQHIFLEDLDLQHENHLNSHYKDNKQNFLQQAVACFGIKKAYTMFPKSLGNSSY